MTLTGFVQYRYTETKEYLEKLYVAFKCHRNLRLVLCCDIENLDKIPFSVIFPHPVGVVIWEKSTIGERVVIRQNATIGARYPSDITGPVIMDDVVVGANALILGPVNVGSNAVIGAGSIVLKDVPAGTVVTGIWK